MELSTYQHILGTVLAHLNYFEHETVKIEWLTRSFLYLQFIFISLSLLVELIAEKISKLLITNLIFCSETVALLQDYYFLIKLILI